MSDGLSEPAYLAFLVSGLFFMARAFRERNNADSLACGVFTGLAYLTRPEGLLILPAFGLTLIALQLRPAWRGSWRSFLSCGTTMLLATVLVGSVYVYATGHISNKPNVEIMAKKFADASDRPEMGGTSGPLFAATFAPSPDKGTRLLQGTRALATELCQGLHYFAVLPVLLGFWWSFPSLRGHPGFWALATYVGLHGFVLIELAMSAGYISDRHVMILVLLDSFFVVACLRELPIRIQAWLKIDPTPKWTRSAPLWFALLFAALIGACLPKATQRLHGNRAENHAAGKWLAQKVAVEDNVFIGDDHAWSHFYSGLIFQEGSEKPFPRDFESNSYIVVTRTRDAEGAPPRPNARLNSDARPVWPESADVSRARVLVYLQKRVYEEHPWPLRRKED
jgi:hypothetical protein